MSARPSLVLASALLAVGFGPSLVGASTISVELTSNALGLGTTNINDSGDGNPVDADQVGKLVTSPVSGQGSVLTVQTDGKAGAGTVANPLLVTITAQSRLDYLGAIGTDVHGGIIYMTDRSVTNLASPSNLVGEGLGVRTFSVNTSTNVRLIDAGTGRARIEGSKEVSGGTDASAPGTAGGNGNGPPHVDELVNFAFDSAQSVQASSIKVVLTKFDDGSTTDRFNLHIDRLIGSDIDLVDIGIGTPGLSQVGSKSGVYQFDFSAVAGLLATDVIDDFSIRAVDPADYNALNGTNLSAKGTAEHFLINGFSASPCIDCTGNVPEPASLGVLGIGALGLLMRRRRK